MKEKGIKGCGSVEIAKVKIIKDRTGAGMIMINKLMKTYPKANIEELIEIIRYVGLVVYHKIPPEEKFKHLM